ncbi:hypothetical protein C8R48DRAFT_740127 [Suillus tomentosus]|nr:hypothetical protein C8R48DRAFT_740127 [Suillus tomentosus]
MYVVYYQRSCPTFRVLSSHITLPSPSCIGIRVSDPPEFSSAFFHALTVLSLNQKGWCSSHRSRWHAPAVDIAGSMYCSFTVPPSLGNPDALRAAPALAIDRNHLKLVAESVQDPWTSHTDPNVHRYRMHGYDRPYEFSLGVNWLKRCKRLLTNMSGWQVTTVSRSRAGQKVNLKSAESLSLTGRVWAYKSTELDTNAIQVRAK